MKKHYVTHVEDTDKSISVAGPVLDYKQWYTDYIKLMEEQAQRKYGLYTPEDAFPTLSGDVTRWSFKGLTNEQMSKNPRLEDADGKGRFLTFKNFAWNGMSGCGGYSLSKETFSYTPDIYSLNFTDPSVSTKEYDVYFQLIGLDENSGVTFNLDIRESGTEKRIKRETYTKDGIYHFEYKSEDDATKLYMIGYNGTGGDRTTFTVKILPYYAGALVFDGVDDYGICENFPILTKEKGYTVVALRQWIEEKNDSTALVSNCKNWGQDGAFLFEYNNLRINFLNVAISFGHVSSVDRGKSPFSYQTSKLYNGKNIKPGSFIGSNELVVGKGNKDFPTVSKAAIWELIILDHDATEEELTKIKNYFVKTYPWLFFNQAWTVVGKSNEDTDRATIANITGNGNNLVLSNFGFAGNSGYGEYPTTKSKYEFPYEIIALRFTPTDNIKNIRIKFVLTGLSEANGEQFAMTIRNSQDKQIDKEIYTKDGTYVFTYEYTGEDQISVWGSSVVKNSETNYTVDIIPDHEGYLVTDGVDDYVRTSDNFTLSEKFTVVGEWELLDNTTAISGLFKNADFFLYSNIKGLSFYCRRDNSATVFNDIKSLTAFDSEGLAYDHNWKEYVDDKNGNGASKTSDFVMGSANNAFSKVAFKNIAMYAEKVLSKEYMIKAYIYLQTLKAK
nr:MAG TPA_asm: hypothetical protein [Caudoviricetes sp.]